MSERADRGWMQTFSWATRPQDWALVWRDCRRSADSASVHVTRLLADTLDPVLTTSVFAPGQTGLHPDADHRDFGSYEGPWPDQSGSIIWCATYQDVQRRYPSLPQAHGDGIGLDFDCVDLTVTITRGSIAEVDFEGLSLAETFAAVGRHDDAQAADRLLGSPAEAASGPLRELLANLLATTTD